MDKIRIGIVGRRGASAIQGLRAVSGVEVAAFCELNPEVLQEQKSLHCVETGFNDFEQMLDHVDAVVLGSPMHLHVPQAIMALRAGKHVLSEVTAAISIEECWRLLDAVKSSGKTYMLAENYCYQEENILIREMVRRGMFGEVYFGEGEYVHEVRFIHHHPNGTPTWRHYWQVGINGNTYCTHEIGPLMQWIKAQNPADRIESVICLGSGVHTDPGHPHEDTNLTLIRLSSGKLLKVRLDMMSNRPPMTYYSLQGVNGVYESGRGGKTSSRVWIGENKTVGWADPHREWEELSKYNDLLPDDWKPHVEAAKASGHGGGDYQVARLFAECLRDQTEPDIDIYDALEWTAAGLCSQISIQNSGASIKVPNFRNPSDRPIQLDSPHAKP